MSRVGQKIVFPEGNKIAYSQDFGLHSCLPSGVEFEIEGETAFHFKLTAYGYGGMHKYGNGAIYIGKEELEEHMKLQQRTLSKIKDELISKFVDNQITDLKDLYKKAIWKTFFYSDEDDAILVVFTDKTYFLLSSSCVAPGSDNINPEKESRLSFFTSRYSHCFLEAFAAVNNCHGEYVRAVAQEKIEKEKRKEAQKLYLDFLSVREDLTVKEIKEHFKEQHPEHYKYI